MNCKTSIIPILYVMCGIFGITSRDNVVRLLLDNLQHLSYRGYDSTGLCLFNGDFEITKTLSDAKNLGPISSKHAYVGIGHTRWATHGTVSLDNAHPHTSHDHVVIVHNGVIQNHRTLKTQLAADGYCFYSETDSEIIAHLLHQLLRHLTPIEALHNMKKVLIGRYAFIAMIKDYPGQIFGLTSNLPLLLGRNKDSFSIASDVLALKHCDEYSIIPNLIPFSFNEKAVSLSLVYQSLPSIKEEALLEKDITYHEMLSQHEIPSILSTYWRTLSLKIERPKHVLFVACGSSFHCAEVAKHWFLGQGIHTTVEVASELKDQPLPSLEDSLVIVISQSGETADTLLSLQSIIKKTPLQSIAITNTPTSSLAQLCQIVIPIHVGIEKGVASTKAVTAQLLSLFYLQQALLKKPVLFNEQQLSASIRTLYTHPDIPKTAHLVATYEHVLCLGKQILFPIAKECALKIKELTYIHAEALPAGELKHGPLALIDETVLSIVLGDSPSMSTCISEIQSREGVVVQIGPVGSFEGIHTPNDPIHGYLLINIACQLLAYHTALILERPIDRPRNLAKSVTVE